MVSALSLHTRRISKPKTMRFERYWVYNNYIGIDIGKFDFVVSLFGTKGTETYSNDDSGIEDFLEQYKDYLSNGFIVLEVTGGYEMRLLLSLCEAGFSFHRANTRKVKNFIRSYGNAAKTDNLDAQALSLYGYERHKVLPTFTPQSKQMVELFELVQRRHDLKQMLIAEKNRLQAPRLNVVKSSCQAIIDVLISQIISITDEIQEKIAADVTLNEKKKVLETIPGIGEVTANHLLILMPELGALNRREVASLAGVAPRSNDSGCYKGYRATAPGRDKIKPILFMAAMVASKSNSSLKVFYERLLANGKKKMVAQTALMRKIITIANAKLRDYKSNLAVS